MIEVKNRRRSTRAPIDMPVFEESPFNKNTARAVNISEWGLRYFMLTAPGARRHRDVHLEFFLPHDTRPIKAIGWVTSERRDRLFHSRSVRFTSIEDSDARRIREYVAMRGARRAA